jgi:basic membrane protein A
MRDEAPLRSTSIARAIAAVMFAVLGTVAACEKFVSSEIGGGIGSSCQTNNQCQASTCKDGICVIPCSPSVKCPSGTLCAASLCQLPLDGGFLYPGEVNSEDYTRSFDRGLSAARNALPYTSLTATENVVLASDVTQAADSFVQQGRTVIVGTSPSHGPLLVDFADQHPDVSFLVRGSRVTRPNLTSFDARTYQAYYLAGIAAGAKSTTHRLGFIASSYSPPIVACINAFALGAQKVNPATIVELKWMGAPHDTNPGTPKRDLTFTLDLVANGADVVAHTLDNNIPVAAISQLTPPQNVFAIGANLNDACEIDPNRCLGTTYFNWGPLLTKLLDDIHKQVPDNGRVLESIQVNAADSVVGFTVSDQVVGATALKQQVDTALTEIAGDDGVSPVFAGPIQSAACEQQTMRMPCVAMGDTLSDGDLDKMCWLVDGVVDHSSGADVQALVPAEQDCAPAAMN